MVYAEEIEGAVLGACLLERSAQAVVLKGMLDGAAFERVSPRKEAGRAGKGMRYERK